MLFNIEQLMALRLLSETRRQLRVSEVATELRLPLSSTSRLLKTLEAQGLLVRLSRNQGYELRRQADLRGNELDRLRSEACTLLRAAVATHSLTGYIATS